MDVIDLIIYIAIAISGTVFGSFFTLAVHRIPKHQDITHERSYCPKCNHKLQFLDLIPVFSYIFLGGKCRYCGEKIRPRYLILEICSGLIFLLLALHRNINFLSTIEEWAFFFIAILTIVCMFITAGIDKELHTIINGVMLYGIIVGIIKIIVMTIFGKSILYNFIGFVIPAVIWMVLKIASYNKQNEKLTYLMSIVKYLGVIGLIFGAIPLAFGIVWVIPFAVLYHLLVRKTNDKQIPFGFLFTIVYTLILLIL